VSSRARSNRSTSLRPSARPRHNPRMACVRFPACLSSLHRRQGVLLRKLCRAPSPPFRSPLPGSRLRPRFCRRSGLLRSSFRLRYPAQVLRRRGQPSHPSRRRSQRCRRQPLPRWRRLSSLLHRRLRLHHPVSHAGFGQCPFVRMKEPLAAPRRSPGLFRSLPVLQPIRLPPRPTIPMAHCGLRRRRHAGYRLVSQPSCRRPRSRLLRLRSH